MLGSSPPGWYPDSSLPGVERWWDGAEWTSVTRPAGGRATGGDQPSTPPRDGFPGAWNRPPAARPSPVPLSATPDGVPLADAGARLAARMVDWGVKTLLSLVIGFNFVEDAYRIAQDWQAQQPTTAPPDLTTLLTDQGLAEASMRFQLVAVLVSLVYTVPMIALRGATPGKVLLGVRVRPLAQEAQPGWGRSLLRWATREGLRYLPYLGAIYLLADSVWPLRDPARQALHDKLPATVVVRSRR